MLDENKKIELNDEVLKKISGGNAEKETKHHIGDRYIANKDEFDVSGIIEEVFEELIDGIQFYKVNVDYFKYNNIKNFCSCYIKVSDEEIDNHVFISYDSDRHIY